MKALRLKVLTISFLCIASETTDIEWYAHHIFRPIAFEVLRVQILAVNRSAVCGRASLLVFIQFGINTAGL